MGAGLALPFASGSPELGRGPLTEKPMPDTPDNPFRGKSVAVVGLARSGLACCDVLTRLGARVVPYDGKPASEIAGAVAEVEALGLTPIVGGAALDYAELDYLVTSPGVRKSAPVLQSAVAAGVPVLGEIEAAYRIARAPILAITGTNGKTTTAVLLGEMLRAAGIETYVAGNIAAGDIALPLIRAAFEASASAAIVAEISSFQLEWISTFRPRVAALLNITPDHGDRQTWGEYVAAKWRIFEYQTAEDFAVWDWSLFKGERFGDYYTKTDPAVNLSTVISPQSGLHPGDLGEEHSVYVRGGELVVEDSSLADGFAPGRVHRICGASEVKLPGAHNLENIMAAAAMATAFGVGIEPIRQVATTFTGVVHRLEYVETIDGVRYVNNSMCTNAAAFAKSLEALPEPKVVIAGGVYKGDDVAALGEAVAAQNVRALVLIGRSAPEIEASARAAGFTNTARAGTMAEAVGAARAEALRGDTVLLAPACASFDMFRDFEDRGDQFKAAVQGLGEEPLPAGKPGATAPDATLPC